MGFTEEELDILEQYTSRKLPKKFRSSLSEILKIPENDYKQINAFIGTRFKNTASASITNSKDFREMLRNVELLFSVACKYGSTHTLPSELYREDSNFEEVNNSSYSNKTFKSYSRNDLETSIFKTSKSTHISASIGSDVRIPFIDVNAILGSHGYSDEKEIILPPFLVCDVIDSSSPNDVKVEITDTLYDEISDVDFSQIGQTYIEIKDSELDELIKLNSKKEISEEDNKKRNLLAKKVHFYMIGNLCNIYNEYMNITMPNNPQTL